MLNAFKQRALYCRGIILSALLCLLCAAGAGFLLHLPEPLFKTDYSPVLFSREGLLLGAKTAADQQWRFPPAGTVPEKFALALIHTEDKRFYRHFGVDPAALLRAVYVNLRAGRIVSGASTLSMQVVRLSRAQPPRTYAEKLREIVLALKLEAAYSKEGILALYAAHAPFGGNVVGLEAAAWRYFGRGPQRLSWAESALLAVLPNNPALVHLARNRTRLLAKRDALLKTLREREVISDLDLQTALLEPLPQTPKPMPRAAPHLLETLYAEQSKTLRYHSYLDASLQEQLSRIINRHSRRLQRRGIHNAAALLIDNRALQVRAYVGNSRPLQQTVRQGHAIDMVKEARSTGSLLKPFLYALMLQQGELTPSMLVADVPRQYGNFRPQNYDRRYRGAVPAREALAKSLNLPAMHLLERYGTERFHAFLRRAGLRHLNYPPKHYGLSLIIGGAEGSLFELARLYAYLVHALHDAAPLGTRLYPNLSLFEGENKPPAPAGELDAGAAWLTLQALLEVVRPGAEGYWRYFKQARKIAWKTGTSFGHRDAWAIGVTPEYTAAVWVGNAGGGGRPEISGSEAAAPLLFEIFEQLAPGTWFSPPDRFLKSIQVCANDGYLANGHCQSRAEKVPALSRFKHLSPHNRSIHVDAAGQRVHSECESVAAMRHPDWFILPPLQAAYYRRAHVDYKPPPDYRPDCRERLSADAAPPIDVLYPPERGQIIIPVELDGRSSKVVLSALHRRAGERLFWHLNEQYLGQTRDFHQWALQLPTGSYRLTLVDEQGARLERRFEVAYAEASYKN